MIKTYTGSNFKVNTQIKQKLLSNSYPKIFYKVIFRSYLNAESDPPVNRLENHPVPQSNFPALLLKLCLLAMALNC